MRLPPHACQTAEFTYPSNLSPPRPCSTRAYEPVGVFGVFRRLAPAAHSVRLGKTKRARLQPFVKEASENKEDVEKDHEVAAYEDIISAHKKAGVGAFAPDPK